MFKVNSTFEIFRLVHLDLRTVHHFYIDLYFGYYMYVNSILDFLSFAISAFEIPNPMSFRPLDITPNVILSYGHFVPMLFRHFRFRLLRPSDFRFFFILPFRSSSFFYPLLYRLFSVLCNLEFGLCVLCLSILGLIVLGTFHPYVIWKFD